MKLHRVLGNLLLLSLFFVSAYAEQVLVDGFTMNPMTCMGVYAKGDVWNPQYDALVEVSIDRNSILKPVNLALVIYEYNDLTKIGFYPGDSRMMGKTYICTESLVKENRCTNATLGAFITDPPENLVPQTTIFTKAIRITNDGSDPGVEQGVSYMVNKTGYYCVVIVDADTWDLQGYVDIPFKATITWRGAGGWLSGSDYPKLTFYGTLSITYFFMAVLWGYLSWRYWADILPIQNYIGAVTAFLALEMGVIWMYYSNYNAYGTQSMALLALVAILNAARNSISFFMLLVVCLGWGVVTPTLGPTMAKCKGLAYCHFFFGVIYASGTMLLDPETAGPIIFLVIFPLAMTMTLFYVWTLHAIKTTLAVLTLKKQTIKATMYTRLWWLLVWSVAMVVALFVVDFMLFWRRNTEGWGAQHWRSKWFLLDGWNNLLYFVTFSVIAFLWRPTDNNRRFGLDQLAQDEDEAVDLEEGLDSARRQGFTKKMRKGGIEEGMEEGIFDLGDESDEEIERAKAKRTTAEEANGEGGSSRTRERVNEHRSGGARDENDNDELKDLIHNDEEERRT